MNEVKWMCGGYLFAADGGMIQWNGKPRHPDKDNSRSTTFARLHTEEEAKAFCDQHNLKLVEKFGPILYAHVNKSDRELNNQVYSVRFHSKEAFEEFCSKHGYIAVFVDG